LGTYGHNDGPSGEALFDSPMGLAVCPSGRIFVADTGNHLIRAIENDTVSTFAETLIFPGEIDWDVPSDFDDEPIGGFADGFNAMFSLPAGLALWGDTLIVADSANNSIRAILPTGETITLAGTGYAGYMYGTTPEFHLPRGVYVLNDTLYIADTGNNVIRAMRLV
jgi:DNA-binding beta-propeller fold protein YncE